MEEEGWPLLWIIYCLYHGLLCKIPILESDDEARATDNISANVKIQDFGCEIHLDSVKYGKVTRLLSNCDVIHNARIRVPSNWQGDGG